MQAMKTGRIVALFAALLSAAADGAAPSDGGAALPPLPFLGDDAPAIAGLLDPGAGFSLPAADQAGVRVTRRLASETIAEDPATGLVVTQRQTVLPGGGAALIATSVANRGARAVDAAAVGLIDWRFRLGAGEDFFRYRPLAHRNDIWYDSTFWTGPDWTRVGRNWQHPGDRTPSVRCFVVPRDGRVAVRGRVRKLHADRATDGVRVAVRFRGRDLWTAEIDGGDDKGTAHDLSVDARAGDAIRFVVHKRGVITCDTTFWDPEIAYADGERFLASEGFAAAAQAGSRWRYELETAEPDGTGLPFVRSFDADLVMREERPRPDHPIACDGGGAFPLVLLSDSGDEGGLLLALPEASPWRFAAEIESSGRLRVCVHAGGGAAPLRLEPGADMHLPPVIVGFYAGDWPNGAAAAARVIETAGEARGLRERLLAAGPALAAAGLDAAACELEYWAMIQNEWREEDRIEETVASYAAAIERRIEKTQRLLADLRAGRGDGFLAAEAGELARLAAEAGAADPSAGEHKSLYIRLRSLGRRIALSNPLFGSSPLLFCKRVPTSYSHLVMQCFGWRARPGGGLFVLDRPGRSLACRDILGGALSGGSVLEPRLSWDARRVVFSFVEAAGRERDPAALRNDIDDGFYHIWEVAVDGTGLRQVTSGPYDDLMPAYLPCGDIVFCSTRRRGYARCFGPQFSPRWHVYTLHRVARDGTRLRALSFHDTNEWFPAVAGDGSILYSRWDYIDRDAVTHQNLWTTLPDGTNPRALWGNATAAPHCTFQIQPIPGGHSVVATAAAHHSIAAGSIIVIDPAAARDGPGAVRRITPEIPFPEAESMQIPAYYEAPWPLADRYFLAGYSPRPLVFEPGANAANALGIYLLDAFGNRELLYRDPAIGSTNPCPLAARPRPPIVPSVLPPDAPPAGEFVLFDVYRGLGDVPRGSIKELRVVQIFPKDTPVAGTPPVGLAGEENGRAILGTVPVEPDGSARFLVPAERPLLFQALDAAGRAYQTMRSVTYVQRGERVSCVGCHEPHGAAAEGGGAPPLALRRPPSELVPGPLGGRPFSFVEAVQPVLDRHCVRCHGGEKPDGGISLVATPAEGFTRSYLALCNDRNFWGGGTNATNAAEALVPRFGARNQIQRTEPGGMYGARGSRLLKLLGAGHHDVRLSADDLARLAAWIDLNAVCYGVTDPAAQARQARGEPVPMPELQ